MQSELRPCPFCGGEAGKVFYIKGQTPALIGDTHHAETCPLAFSWGGFYRPTPEEAITAWNTRASDAEIERNRAEIERLREAGKALLDACYKADACEELSFHIDGSLLDAMSLAIWPEIWNDAQVSALNAYQELPGSHPFTCGNDRTDRAHKEAQEEHGGELGQLVATRQGWACNACDYRQFWAHDFMFHCRRRPERPQP